MIRLVIAFEVSVTQHLFPHIATSGLKCWQMNIKAKIHNLQQQQQVGQPLVLSACSCCSFIILHARKVQCAQLSNHWSDLWWKKPSLEPVFALSTAQDHVWDGSLRWEPHTWGLALDERGMKWELRRVINTKQVIAHIQSRSSQTSHTASAGCTARGILTRCLVEHFTLHSSHYCGTQCRQHLQHCRLPSLQGLPE